MTGLSQNSFHHLGFACVCVENTSRKLERVGWKSGTVFEDEKQGVRGIFMTGGGPRIELLENLPGSAMLDQFLKRGDYVFYHMGYLTDSMEESVCLSRESGGKLICPPMPAVAFDMRNICFVAFRGGIVVEFIERERK